MQQRKPASRRDGGTTSNRRVAGHTWFLVLGVGAVCLALGLLMQRFQQRGRPVLAQTSAGPFFLLPAPVPQHPLVANLTRLQQAAAVVDAGMLKSAPRPGRWDARYRNPCWQAPGQAGAPSPGVVNCLPYALLPGFMTGIGSIVAKLKAHPNVVLDAGDAGHWGADWSYWSEYRNSFQDTYLARIRDSGATQAALDKDPRRSIVIDGGRSSIYYYWAGCGKLHTAFATVAVAKWKVCHDNFTHGPKYTQCMEDTALRLGRAADHEVARRAGLDHDRDLHLPLLMRAVWADRPPRLVLMVRDPVDRLISNYYRRKNYYEKYGRNATGLEAFVADQLQAWRACLEGRTLHGRDGRGPPEGAPRTAEDCYLRFESLGMKEELTFYHNDQLFRGLYAPYLRLWLRFMPHDRVLVLHYDDLAAQPHRTTNVVLAFLGLPLLPDSALREAAREAEEARFEAEAEARDGGRALAQAQARGEGAAWPVLGEEAAGRVMRAGAPPGDEAELGPRAGRATVRTRELLRDFYRPFNVELAQLLRGDQRVLKWNV